MPAPRHNKYALRLDDGSSNGREGATRRLVVAVGVRVGGKGDSDSHGDWGEVRCVLVCLAFNTKTRSGD